MNIRRSQDINNEIQIVIVFFFIKSEIQREKIMRLWWNKRVEVWEIASPETNIHYSYGKNDKVRNCKIYK